MREEMTAEDWEPMRPLLALWVAPAAAPALDSKVLAAFRRRAESLALKDNLTSLPELSMFSSEEVKTMKQCQTCFEEFPDKFIHCPIDATLLGEATTGHPAHAADSQPVLSFAEHGESTLPFLSSDAYHLTIMEDAGLVRRLFAELTEAARASQLTWPEFKRDPLGFTRRSAAAYGAMTWRFFSSPNVAIASLAAILFMMTAVVGLVWLDHRRAQQQALASADKRRDDLEFKGMVPIPDEQQRDGGAAGLNNGNGGGSKPRQEKPSGGGGGGRDEQLTASNGKVPPGILEPPLLAPNLKAPPIKNPELPTPITIQADPLLFPPDARAISYGDPKSKSSELSNGTGTGNGVGDGSGVGVGSGEGNGYGSGRDFNTGGDRGKLGGGGNGGRGEGGPDYAKIFKPNEVEQKARIISKPSPEYTEEARKNQIVGTVTLRMVFSSSGAVTGIKAMSSLPFGLTEKAIAAARQIKFSPAMKDGHPVSQYIQVEYNFNIY